MSETLFQNVNLINPKTKFNDFCDVLIKDSYIKSIQKPNEIIPSNKTKVISYKNSILIPGIIDLRVTSRDPGEPHIESLESLLKAAAHGGITSLACLPNTSPCLDDSSMVDSLKLRAESIGLSKLLIYGAATKGLKDQEIAELGLLSEAGVVGFSNGDNPIYNPLIMQRVLSYSSMFSLPIIQHADVPELSFETEATSGEIATRLGLRGVPSITEVMLIQRDIELLKVFGGKYHVSHISTQDAVNCIKNAKNEGINITCDTSPNYFILNDSSLINYDTRYKLSPPLRNEINRVAIIEGIKDGTIDAISSDHVPQDRDAKILPFSIAKPGSLGIETLLSASLSLFHSKQIPLIKTIELLTSGPASILKLDSGNLTKGTSADMTLIDLEVDWTVNGNQMQSLSSNTCLEGIKMKGKVLGCWRDGKNISFYKEYDKK